LDAYNCGSVESAKTIGSRLASDPDVSTAIQDLMHQEGIGRRYRVKRLRDVINAADLGIASRGLEMANKLTAEYAPEKVDIDAQMASVHIMLAALKKNESDKKLEIKNEDEDEYLMDI
jgi:hypothetical protein